MFLVVLFCCVIASFYHLDFIIWRREQLHLHCSWAPWLAAYADADAVALARAAAVAFVAFVSLAMAAWRKIAAASECATVRLRELFEQQHALLQCAKACCEFAMRVSCMTRTNLLYDG